MSRYLYKMVQWVTYRGTVKPSESISDARWRAMVRFIQRNYLDEPAVISIES